MKSFNLTQAIMAALISSVLALVTPAAFAQDSYPDGLYFGISGGYLDEDPPSGFYFPEDSNAGIGRFHGGYRFQNGFAMDLSLNAIGDLVLSCPRGTQTIGRGSFSFAMLYHIPFSKQFSIFPKLGIAYASVDNGNEACIRYGSTTTGAEVGAALLYGAGAELRFTENLAVRAEIDTGISAFEDENYAVSAGLVVHIPSY